MDNERVASTQLLPWRPSEQQSERYLDAPNAVVFPSGASPAQPSSLYEYWRILTIHKKAVVLITVCGLLLGVALTFILKPVYRAKTALEVLNINQDFFYNKQTNPLSDSDVNSDTSDLQTQVRILSGDTLLYRVIAKLSPEHKSLGNDFNPDKQNPLLVKIAKSVKVRAVGRTRVIEISADAPDPKLAAAFANTLVTEFINENLDSRWKATEKTSEWLGHELDSARSKLQGSEDALQSYARESGILLTGDNINVSEEKLRQVQQQLSAAASDRIAKQSRFELIKSASVDTLPDIVNNEELADIRAKIVDLRRQAAELSTTYTPEYIRVKRIEAEISTLEEAFAREKGVIVSRIQNEYTEALRRQNLLQGAYDQQAREVGVVGEKSIQYNVLKREVQSNQQLYDSMLQLFKQSRVASAMRASNIRVLEPALIPWRPYSPDIRINAAAGLLLGLIGGILFTVIRKRADRTIQDPGEIRLWAGIPELGVIPAVAKIDVHLHSLSPSEFGIVPLNRKQKLNLVRLKGQQTMIAEAFRTIMTSLLSSDALTQARLLVLTSASPADGKSTVVSNLAIAAAGVQRNVLVIDADLRRPTLHKLFSLKNEKGLTDLLSNSGPMKDDPSEIIQETSIPNLHILTAGPARDNAGQLLHLPMLGTMLSNLRLKYDMILIDTPPILQISDARVIGRLADGVVLVTRAEQTTREALTAANEQLNQDRVRVFGAILNGWNPNKSIHGYYGYKGNAYYEAYERYAIK